MVYADVILLRWWFYFFFFKQKTAYEMRISDWSSDVCSSDLLPEPRRQRIADQQRDRQAEHHQARRPAALPGRADRRGHQRRHAEVRAVRQSDWKSVV